MKHLGMTISYRGDAFNGYQSSPGMRSVEAEMIRALQTVTRCDIQNFSASGRTDSGVSVRNQTCSFDVDTDALDLRKWSYGVSCLLRNDITIKKIVEMPPEFHARHSRHIKQYSYSIYNYTAPPLDRDCWHVADELDVAAMQRAAALLEGSHDFRAFRDAHCAARTTMRTMLISEFSKNVPYLDYRIIGSGFLMYMVRIIVGTLVEVGKGRRSIESVADLLLPTAIRPQAGQTAPPAGLSLDWVRYDNEQYDQALSPVCSF